MNRDIPITPDTDVRETPDSLFEPLRKEFQFNLDACATRANAKCDWFYSETGLYSKDSHSAHSDRCGLTGSWVGDNVFCNPPFSDIGAWCNKAWFSGARCVVMLVPATRTEQPWWHEYVEPWRDGKAPPEVLDPWRSFTTRNLKGRVHFLENGGPIYRKNKDGTLWLDPKSAKPVVSSPKFGCTLLIWQT